MNNADDLSKVALGQAVKSGIQSTNKNDNASKIRLGLALAVLLVLIASKSIHIFFRKNFILGNGDLMRLIACSLIFFITGIISINETALVTEFDKIVYYLTGVMLMLLGFYILIKSLSHHKKSAASGNSYSEKGQSTILRFLIDDKKSENVIQDIVEPFTLLALGFFIFGLNPIAGAVLMACAVSYWLELLRKKILIDNMQEKARKLNAHHNQEKTTNRVKSAT